MRISLFTSYASEMARRSATLSGVRPPMTGSSRLKQVSVMSGASVNTARMPRLARLGAILPPGAAWVMKSSGTRSMKSCSLFRKDSQRGWFSSMTSTTTRSTMGMRRPLSRA